MNNLTNNILTKIQAGDIAMKPRWHFVLRTVLVTVGSIFFVLLLMYTVSFIVFMLRFSGAAFVPFLGGGGLAAMLLAIPWLLVVLAFIFVVVLEILVQRFSVARQTPILYSIFGVVVVSFVGSYIILQTPLHGAVQQLAAKHQAPVIGSLYRSYGNVAPAQVTAGTVVALTETGFVLRDRKDIEWDVHVDDQTRGLDRVRIEPTAALVVLGERSETGISATGVKYLPADVRPPRTDRFGNSRPPRNQ